MHDLEADQIVIAACLSRYIERIEGCSSNQHGIGDIAEREEEFVGADDVKQ